MKWLTDWLERIAAYIGFFFSGAAYQKWKDRAKHEKQQRIAIEEENERLRNRPNTVVDITDRLHAWREKL